MGVRKLRNSWWVDFQIHHTRHRKRSPDNSRSGALAYETVLRQRLARGEPLVTEPSEPQPTFEQFAWRWFDTYVTSNNKFSEQRAKRGILSRTLVPFFGTLPVGQIAVHHIEQYKAEQIKSGISRKTIRNRLTVLKKALACAYDWLQLGGSPPKVKWPSCPPSRTDFLSHAECSALLSHAEGIVHEMALMTLRTGMRQGELKGLQWSSIDWENRIVTIRHSFCDIRKALDTPKSNRERHIPLDAEMYDILTARKRSAGYVFTDTGGKPFNSPRLNLLLASLCKKAGLRTVTWHVLLHTFASHLAMRGIPLNVVQTLLGHASITTTMRYAHVAPSTLRTAIEMLSSKNLDDQDPCQPAVNQWLHQQFTPTRKLVA
jgi:integrase